LSQLLVAREISAVREYVTACRKDGKSIALVPTMGNLHAGHLSLMELAGSQADKVICSIFVNPTQFGATDDLDRYPRTEAQDEAMLTAQGQVDFLFLPNKSTVYPFGTESGVAVNLPELSKDLCGTFRPGHFNGVASVVLRLLNIVTPDILVLGEKDYQQRILLTHMLQDFHLPIAVVAGDIFREADGLAMSSRNSYLTPEERSEAPKLYGALQEIAEALRLGRTDYRELETATFAMLSDFGFRPDYVAVRRACDLATSEKWETGDARIILAAAWLGSARLIDNVVV
jgi:pantoate--beta-alanine ligase